MRTMFSTIVTVNHQIATLNKFQFFTDCVVFNFEIITTF